MYLWTQEQAYPVQVLIFNTKLGIKPDQHMPSNVRDAVVVGGERHASLVALSLPISIDGPVISHQFHVF